MNCLEFFVVLLIDSNTKFTLLCEFFQIPKITLTEDFLSLVYLYNYISILYGWIFLFQYTYLFCEYKYLKIKVLSSIILRFLTNVWSIWAKKEGGKKSNFGFFGDVLEVKYLGKIQFESRYTTSSDAAIFKWHHKVIS